MARRKPFEPTVTQTELEKHLNPCSMFCPGWTANHNGLCPHKIVMDTTDPNCVVDVCGLHPVRSADTPTPLEQAAAMAQL